MGLLDDAIREHLELKRTRGADPTEVIRQEREALGPSVQSEALASEPPSEYSDEAAHSSPPEALEDERTPESVRQTTEGADALGWGGAPTPPATDLASDLDPDAELGLETPDEAQRAIVQPTPEQETAEVDMQAMLGVEDEHGLADGEGLHRDDPDPPDPGEEWGHPHSARE